MINNQRNIKRRNKLKYLRNIMGDKKLNSLLSYRNLGYFPNLKNPETFNEKIQWIKLNANIENLGRFVDKYTVREYVSDNLGKDYLIPLIKVIESDKEIEFHNLPKSFIMKASHTSGYNYIVNDLKKEDFNKLKEISSQWLKINYYLETGERNYKNIKPNIVIEELISDEEDLIEYKVHCYEGVPKIIQVNGNENNVRKGNYYTAKWEKLPFYKGTPAFKKEPKKPKELSEIILAAKKLSSVFLYVRVDLYCVSGKIYFGELTFTPSGGLAKFSDKYYDYLMGSFLEIQREILIK
ncbi:TupA-like ATPgrasp [Alkalibacterium gilvum]|uniref:TupA-like ATPgrasp n=1 Tax=Alkalibacterium gilvum TaxID=1130080 RepID=A0A1H6TL24_9LACT|nr:ATP-grasp fold amidoligase family protein [Alkalibacterium gilvum]SEI76940.1 TupA-like ATPgrasp [Alkalibacterium gilvum]